MLFAGGDDGVYRIKPGQEPAETTIEKVLEAEEVYRIRQFDGVGGLFVAAESGLYHSPDGDAWSPISLPEERAYAVTANPAGDRLYVGTRPARVFVAECSTRVPTDEDDWEAVSGFRELRERTDWGIPRHDGLAQLRSLRTHPDAPDRIVAGIEVGGVYVSDDNGATWTNRCIDGFDAPHTDDVHHLALADSETIVASTGSGLYRSTDVGLTWERLDADHDQRYFREAFATDGVVYAGGAPASAASWEENTDHALFEGCDGRTLERVPSPTPEEVIVGWCAIDGDVVAATHRGTLSQRRSDEWREIGTIPTPTDGVIRYLPLTWHE